MCPTVPDAGADRRELLTAFLTGDFRQQRRFVDEFTPVMTGQARRLAADLPRDLRDEVVQTAFLILLQTRPDRYDPTKGSPETFIRMIMWDAMRRVRSDNAAPGRMTRRENERRKRHGGATAPRPAPEADRAPPPIVPLDDVAETAGTVSPAFAAVECRLDADRILEAAGPRMAAALRLIFWDDASRSDAADAVALPRTTLQGRIEALGRRYACAA